MQATDPSRAGGANAVSLAEARDNYRTLRVSDPRHLEAVRAPLQMQAQSCAGILGPVAMAGEREISIERSPGRSIRGLLSYVDDEHAFSFRPADPRQIRDLLGSSGPALLSFGTIQVEVALPDGRCLFAWGYSPRQGWRAADLTGLPTPEPGECYCVTELVAGVSLRVSTAPTQVMFDQALGRVAALVAGLTPDWAVQIADGVSLLVSETGVPVGVLFQLPRAEPE